MDSTILLASVAAALLLLWRAWGRASRHRYRARVILTIATPDGDRTGASVFEEETYYHWGQGPGRTRALKIRGQAIAVDLGQGGLLFMRVPSAERLQQVLDSSWHNDWVESGLRIVKGEASADPISVAPDRLAGNGPLFLRFRDIGDPASVEAVDPLDLASIYGPGYAIKSVTVQLTQDPVSSGIECLLPWLPEYYSKLFDGKRIHDGSGLANQLGAGSFSTDDGLRRRASRGRSSRVNPRRRPGRPG